MALSILDPIVIGAAKVRGTDGSTSAAGYFRAGNVEGVTDNGVGNHTVNLVEPIPSRCVPKVQIYGGTGRANAQVALTSSTAIGVTIFNDAGAAADLDYSIEFVEYPN